MTSRSHRRVLNSWRLWREPERPLAKFETQSYSSQTTVNYDDQTRTGPRNLSLTNIISYARHSLYDPTTTASIPHKIRATRSDAFGPPTPLVNTDCTLMQMNKTGTKMNRQAHG